MSGHLECALLIEDSASGFHQGARASCARTNSPGYMAAIFPFSPSTMREAWQIWAEQKLPLGPQDWDLLADRSLTAQPQQTRSIDPASRAAQGRRPSDPCTSAHDLRFTRTPDRCHASPRGCLAKASAEPDTCIEASGMTSVQQRLQPALLAVARTPWC